MPDGEQEAGANSASCSLIRVPLTSARGDANNRDESVVPSGRDTQQSTDKDSAVHNM